MSNGAFFLKDYHHRRLINSIKSYFLGLPNMTKEDWENVIRHDVRSFNLIWRGALRQRFPDIQLNYEPPPVHYRGIYNFSSHGFNRTHDPLVIDGEE